MPSLEPQRMWNFLRTLLERTCGALDGDSAMTDALDAVVDLLRADRGLVFLAHPDGTTQVVAGRTQRRQMDPLEQAEIAKTFVSQALATGQFVHFDASEQPIASHSAASLGVTGALAAPLTPPSSSRVRGVLYIDFRNARALVEPLHVELFLATATVFGILLNETIRQEAVRGQLAEARNHVVVASPHVGLEELLGYPSLAPLRAEVDLALRSSAPMLVLGESGSGKTMLAHAVAQASGRRPVVRVMLGASDDLNTVTSELFGHERGAFSGATGKRVGLVEFAHGGTLVLDELLNLTPNAQKLLLDFVQFGTYRPLGYDKREPKQSTVRIVAATNGDIHGAIREGRLREDLYHRLAHIEVEMPALRNRRQDIPVLAERFLRRVDASRPWQLSLEVRRLLVSPTFEWSGNIRQLERLVLRARERAAARDPENPILAASHFELRELEVTGPTHVTRSADTPDSRPPADRWQHLQAERARLDQLEHGVLRQALVDAGGVVAHAARNLGIARTTLASRIEVLGLRSS